MDFGLEPTLTNIGRARWTDAYLCRTLHAAGAPLAFASDWPVTDISVIRGIGAALTRQAYPGATDERVDLMTTLHAYTAGGAWAAHRDLVTGTLAVGLAADVVILTRDIEAVPPAEVAQIAIARTICGGRTTYSA
jgi:predicted amidohydrolase YtcJ